MDPIKYSLVMIVLGLIVIFPQFSFAGSDRKPKAETKEKTKEREEKKGKLAQFEEAVEKKDGKKGKKHKKHVHEGDGCCNDGGSSCDDGDYDWAYPFFEVMAEGTYQLLLGLPSRYPPGFTLREYSPYPYADPIHGRYGGNATRPMSFDATGYYLYNSSSLDGFGFRSRFSPHPVLGLEFQFTEFHEQLAVGKDRLAMFNLMANFNRVRSPSFNFWWGVGMKGMHAHRTYTGFAYNLGMEIYPFRPVSFQLVHNGGWLNGVYVPEFYGTVNLHLSRFAVMAGYQSWSAGSASLDGFVLGLKVHI